MSAESSEEGLRDVNAWEPRLSSSSSSSLQLNDRELSHKPGLERIGSGPEIEASFQPNGSRS